MHTHKITCKDNENNYTFAIDMCARVHTCTHTHTHTHAHADLMKNIPGNIAFAVDTYVYILTYVPIRTDVMAECQENIAFAVAANASKILVDLCKDKSLIVQQHAAAAIASLATHSAETRKSIIQNVSRHHCPIRVPRVCPLPQIA
jgi:hypothetical protein